MVEPVKKKHPGGRPLKFETVEILQALINDYFAVTPKEEYAITGLAVHLDTDRQTLVDYQGRPEFTDTIKRAKNKIELAYELRLIRRGNAGDIFALKNFDWKDKTEQELTGGDGQALFPAVYLPQNKEVGTAKTVIESIDKPEEA